MVRDGIVFYKHIWHKDCSGECIIALATSCDCCEAVADCIEFPAEVNAGEYYTATVCYSCLENILRVYRITSNFTDTKLSSSTPPDNLLYRVVAFTLAEGADFISWDATKLVTENELNKLPVHDRTIALLGTRVHALKLSDNGRYYRWDCVNKHMSTVKGSDGA